MSDTVLIALIVAVAVGVVLYIFRGQLSKFVLKFGKEGLETELTTHSPQDTSAPSQAVSSAAPRPSVIVRGNIQEGADHVIDVRRDNVEVIENLQEGERQEISVGPDES